MPDARALGAAVAAAIGRAIDDRETADRLFRYATRHVPIEASAEGSPFIPPMYTLRVAAALGLPASQAMAIAVSGCLYFAAADVFDDCADGDVRRAPGLDLNDGCRLMFLHQRVLAEGGLDPAVVVRLVALFADCGLQMAAGQERDLLGTNAVEAFEPVEMCSLKTGGELAAVIAAPAVAMGLDPAPWRAFGTAFGAMLQLLTDYFDLFLDPTSDDWAAGKPSLPIRVGLDDRRHGDAVALMLAGDRDRPDRKGRGLWHLVQAGAGKALDRAMGRLRRAMKKAEKGSGHPAVLVEIRAELEDWIGGVVEALAEYRRDEAPPIEGLSAEIERCRAAARGFLATDPRFAGAADVHRSAAGVIEGDVLGPALACVALAEEGIALDEARAALVERAGREGWRYRPGEDGAPVDLACTAAATLALGADGRLPAAARSALDRIGPAQIEAGALDPGVAALAALARWRLDHDRAGLAPLLDALAAAVVDPSEPAPGGGGEPGAPPRVQFTAVARDAWVAAVLIEAGRRRRHRPALDAIATRFAARRRLDARFGTVLDTALCGLTLARLGRLDRPRAVVRALVDAQAADGGFPPDRYWQAIPHRVTSWYGSRVTTTAHVLEAVRVISGG